MSGARHRARCVLAGGHTNVALVEKDGQAVLRADADSSADARLGLSTRPEADEHGRGARAGRADRRRRSRVSAPRRRDEPGDFRMGIRGRRHRPAASPDAPRRLSGRRHVLSREAPRGLGGRRPHGRHGPGGDDLRRLGQPGHRRHSHALHRRPRNGHRRRSHHRKHRRRPSGQRLREVLCRRAFGHLRLRDGGGHRLGHGHRLPAGGHRSASESRWPPATSSATSAD